MDQKLLFLINHEWTSPALDSFMATMSCFAAWVPVLVVICVLAMIMGGFKARTMLLTLALVIAISDVLVSDTIKRTVNRPRPREALAGVRVLDLQPAAFRFLSIFRPPAAVLSPTPADDPHGHSFPSGHTINNFSAATVLALFYRRRGWLYFIPASAVGYSRIYVGAHWPSDVLISAILGVGQTLLLLTAIEWTWRKYAGRWMPGHPSLLGGAAA